MSHTPTPIAVKVLPDGRVVLVSDQTMFSGSVLAVMAPCAGKEYAEEIALAINAHAGLVAALEAFEGFSVGISGGDSLWHELEELKVQARAALVAAKE